MYIIGRCGGLTHQGYSICGGIRFVGTVGSFVCNGSASTLILLGTFATLWIGGLEYTVLLTRRGFLLMCLGLGDEPKGRGWAVAVRC